MQVLAGGVGVWAEVRARGEGETRRGDATKHGRRGAGGGGGTRLVRSCHGDLTARATTPTVMRTKG